jgi:PIN domain nuclease of toxin-antitoxin system
VDILVDTHVFLWLLSTPKKLKFSHLKQLQDKHNKLYLSSISIAELMIKRSINKLNFDFEVLDVLNKMDITVLDFDGRSAIILGTLPLHHKDPFDRMIISQSLSGNIKLLSYDGKFLQYSCDLL